MGSPGPVTGLLSNGGCPAEWTLAHGWTHNRSAVNVSCLDKESQDPRAGMGDWVLSDVPSHCPSLLTIFAVGVVQLPSGLLGTGGGLTGRGSGLLRHRRPRRALTLSVAASGRGVPFVSSGHGEVRPLLGQLVQFLRRRGGRTASEWSGSLLLAHVAGEQTGERQIPREKQPASWAPF